MDVVILAAGVKLYEFDLVESLEQSLNINIIFISLLK